MLVLSGGDLRVVHRVFGVHGKALAQGLAEEPPEVADVEPAGQGRHAGPTPGALDRYRLYSGIDLTVHHPIDAQVFAQQPGSERRGLVRVGQGPERVGELQQESLSLFAFAQRLLRALAPDEIGRRPREQIDQP